MKLQSPLSVLLLSTTVCVWTSAQSSADEIARWDFDNEPAGWEPSDDTELALDSGSLKINSKGEDSYFSTSVDGKAGEHRLSISAKFRGNADFQVFWTTEAEPTTSEEKSVHGELRGSDAEFRTLKLYFSTDSPVTDRKSVV